MKPLLIFVLAVLSLTTASAQTPDYQAMLAKIDKLTNMPTDFTATYTDVAIRPGQDTSVFSHLIYRRDKDNKFLVILLAPNSKKGQGYLEVDNNLWFYDPNSRLFSHTSLKDNWQNSDAMNSDFYKTSFAADYTVTTATEATLGAYPVSVLDLKATNDRVTYPFKKLWIRKDLGLILKSEDSSLSQRLMRTAYYPEYVRIGEQYLASRMLFVDNLNVGNKTQMTMTDPSTAPLADTVFQKSSLEQVSR